jgi:hypothetical protein
MTILAKMKMEKQTHIDRAKSIFCFFASTLKEKKKRQTHILAHLVAPHTSDRFATKRAKIYLPAPSWVVLLLLTILFSANCTVAQTTTTYKNKSGNPVGYSKQTGNKTTYYDKSHNKTGSSKTTNGNTTTYYNKQGNKTITSKTK